MEFDKYLLKSIFLDMVQSKNFNIPKCTLLKIIGNIMKGTTVEQYLTVRVLKYQ